MALRSGTVAATIATQPGTSLATTGKSATAMAVTSKSTPSQPPCHLLQLNRLHFVVADSAEASQLSTSADVVRSYDLVSVNPKSDRVLHQASTAASPAAFALFVLG